jgi:phage shock protein PspC (stress-responsive transcriptional regulator)
MVAARHVACNFYSSRRTRIGSTSAAWAVLSIGPGAVSGGVIAYLVAWLVIPESTEPASPPHGRRLTRSATDSRIAGVCGGLAEYLASTPLPSGCSG